MLIDFYASDRKCGRPAASMNTAARCVKSKGLSA